MRFPVLYYKRKFQSQMYLSLLWGQSLEPLSTACPVKNPYQNACTSLVAGPFKVVCPPLNLEITKFETLYYFFNIQNLPVPSFGSASGTPLSRPCLLFLLKGTFPSSGGSLLNPSQPPIAVCKNKKFWFKKKIRLFNCYIIYHPCVSMTPV